MFKNTIMLLTILFSSFSFASTIVGNGEITYVADGDTFDVKVFDSRTLQSLINSNYVGLQHVDTRNGTFRVRLANVNTEESKHKNSSKNTKFGQETSNIVKNTYTGVIGEFRCYKKGKYERAICSFITERNIDIGIWLIKNDYSPYVKSFGRHPEFHTEYVNASRSKGNSGYALGDAFAVAKTNHRNNSYHNDNKYIQEHSNINQREQFQEGVHYINERVKLVIQRAKAENKGKNLEEFINRANNKLQSTGNLDMFMNRNK